MTLAAESPGRPRCSGCLQPPRCRGARRAAGQPVPPAARPPGGDAERVLTAEHPTERSDSCWRRRAEQENHPRPCPAGAGWAAASLPVRRLGRRGDPNGTAERRLLRRGTHSRPSTRSRTWGPDRGAVCRAVFSDGR